MEEVILEEVTCISRYKKINLPSYMKLKAVWKLIGKEQRLGQFFMNRYVKRDIHNLWFADEKQSELIIKRWLEENGYIENLPEVSK